MSRSINKGPYINYLLTGTSKKNDIIKVSNTSFTILPGLVGKYYKVYTGKSYKTIKITYNMIGFKIGEFIKTRQIFIYKKKKKKKKR